MTQIQNNYRGYQNQNRLDFRHNKNLSAPSFKGINVETGDGGKKSYEIYLPYSDRKDRLVTLITADLSENKGHYSVVKGSEAFHYAENNGELMKKFTISADTRKGYKLVTVKADKNGKAVLGLDKKPIILEEIPENTLKVDGFNMTPLPSRPFYSLPKTMYHLMPGTFNSADKLNEYGLKYDPITGNGAMSDELRHLPQSPAGKYGGDLRGFINKLDYLSQVGVSHILSTPMFGQDRFASGYWTTNAYQMTSSLVSELSPEEHLNSILYNLSTTTSQINNNPNLKNNLMEISNNVNKLKTDLKADNKLDINTATKTINSKLLKIMAEEKLDTNVKTNLSSVSNELSRVGINVKYDFHSLVKEMFKRKQSLVADGAFVNEGWEGLNLSNMLLYGDKTPSYYAFETHFFPFHPMQPGLISPNVGDNLKVKIVNGPFKINEKGEYVKNKDYNPKSKKPTYVQIYDNRRVSAEKINDHKNLIDSYDKYCADIKSNNDTVHLYKFELWPDEVKDRIKAYKRAKKTLVLKKAPETLYERFLARVVNVLNALRLPFPETKRIQHAKVNAADYLLDIPQSAQRPHSAFKLTLPENASGVNLWDGKKDIAKFRFTLPAQVKAELLRTRGKEEVAKIEKAIIRNQDDKINCGRFWTREADKTLTEHSSRALNKKFVELNSAKAADVAKNSAEFEEIKKNIPSLKAKSFKELDKNQKLLVAMYELAGTSVKGTEYAFDCPNDTANILPESLKNVIEKGKLTAKDINGALSNNYNGLSPASESIMQELKSYPLESIDFPPEICSILASPYIKTISNDVDAAGNFKFNIEKLEPEEKEVYKSLQNVYNGRVKNQIVSILKAVDESRPDGHKILNNAAELTDEGKEVFKLISGDVIKFIMVDSIANVQPTFDKANKKFDYAPFVNETFDNIAQLNRTTPKTAAESFVYSLKTGLPNVEQHKADFVNGLKEKVNGIDLDSLRASKLLVNKSESGLCFRIDAAKDIGDWDAVKSGKATFEEEFEKVIGFWKKYTNAVRKENPQASIIVELTDLDKLIDYGPGRFKNVGEAERIFIDETGVTAPSNYKYTYSSTKQIFNAKSESKSDMTPGPEAGIHEKNICTNMDRNLLDGWSKGSTGEAPGYYESCDASSLFGQHLFIGNQDKERIGHASTLNLKLFYEDQPKFETIFRNRELAKLPGEKSVYEIIDEAYSKNPFMNWKSMLENDTPDARRAKIMSSIDGTWMLEDKGNVISSYIGELVQQNMKPVNTYESTAAYARDYIQKNKQAMAAFKEGYTKGKLRYLEQIAKDGPGKAMKVALETSIDKAVKGNNISESQAKNLQTALEKLYKNDPQQLGVRPLEDNLQKLEIESGLSKLKPEEKIAMERAIHKEFVTSEAGRKYKAMLGFLSGQPGVPTNYAGDEFFQGGYEANNNSICLERGLVRHEYIDPNSLEYRPFIDAMHKDLFNNSLKLRNMPWMSPLNNGYPVVLNNQGNGENAILGIYRYNKERDVITLSTNSGLDSNKSVKLNENRIRLSVMDDNKGVKFSLGNEVPLQIDDKNLSNANIRVITDNNNNPVVYRRSDSKVTQDQNGKFGIVTHEDERYLLMKDNKGYFVGKVDNDLLSSLEKGIYEAKSDLLQEFKMEADEPIMHLFRERNFDGKIPEELIKQGIKDFMLTFDSTAAKAVKAGESILRR